MIVLLLFQKERESYEVVIQDGKLVYKQNGAFVETVEGSKWIFVLSTTRTLYVGKKKKGVFQHSSFLSGGATTAAGRLVAHDGVLKAIWPYSGHYHPTEENFREFISFLEEHSVDLTNVKVMHPRGVKCYIVMKCLNRNTFANKDDIFFHFRDVLLTMMIIRLELTTRARITNHSLLKNHPREALLMQMIKQRRKQRSLQLMMNTKTRNKKTHRLALLNVCLENGQQETDLVLAVLGNIQQSYSSEHLNKLTCHLVLLTEVSTCMVRSPHQDQARRFVFLLGLHIWDFLVQGHLLQQLTKATFYICTS